MEVTGAAQERQGEGQAVDHVPPPCFQRTCLLFCRSCSLRLYELQGFVFCFVFFKFSLKKKQQQHLPAPRPPTQELLCDGETAF